MLNRTKVFRNLAIGMLAVCLAAAAEAQVGTVLFHDIVSVDYQRKESASEAIWDAIKQEPFYGLEEIVATPAKSRGAPGVAILDYDLDGDQDIFVTNGPQANSSLYSNQLIETGTLTFVDVAEAAGVGAFEADSSGVCYGDIDNDGDPDLLVLNMHAANSLFENQGDGTFTDISDVSGIAAEVFNAVSCSMGDINGDGRLDIAIANLFDTNNSLPMYVEPFALNEPNQLLLNLGGNNFGDVSETSGFRNLDLTFGAPSGAATITWAIAMVDYDLDGDIDILQADDQAVIPEGVVGGIDRGYIQVFENLGSGQFVNRTYESRLSKPGGWMGFAFADFNRDGLLDFYSTNFGNHPRSWARGGPFDTFLDGRDSRWFLRHADGTYYDPSYPVQQNTPFGWGVVAVDYDNDGDSDILSQGGMDGGPFVMTAPAVALNNDGAANFSRDIIAFSETTNHLRRAINGVAAGDLNLDGWVDVVSASGFDSPEPLPLTPNFQLGGEWDVDAYAIETFSLIDPENFVFVWNGLEFPDGSLSIDMNSGGNGNGWVKVKVVGSVDITPRGRNNRDGIGAVITFTPEGDRPSMKPIMGGSSYASQNDLTAHFGTGRAAEGTIEVLWPGGVRNRFYVEAGETFLAPEIPCSFDGELRLPAYSTCVLRALDDLFDAGIVGGLERIELFRQSIRAYYDVHR